MDVRAALEAGHGLLERLGIEVRREHLGGAGGGFCTLRGKRVLFVDLDADAASQWDVCRRALAELPERDRVFIPPQLREAIDD